MAVALAKLAVTAVRLQQAAQVDLTQVVLSVYVQAGTILFVLAVRGLATNHILVVHQVDA